MHGFALQGLIFVVDSNDRERVQEAQDELGKMVSEEVPCQSGRQKSLSHNPVVNFLFLFERLLS